MYLRFIDTLQNGALSLHFLVQPAGSRSPKVSYFHLLLTSVWASQIRNNTRIDVQQPFSHSATCIHHPVRSQFAADASCPYRAEVLVQQFHVSVDDLQRQELVVIAVDRTAKVQRCVPVDETERGRCQSVRWCRDSGQVGTVPQPAEQSRGTVAVELCLIYTSSQCMLENIPGFQTL